MRLALWTFGLYVASERSIPHPCHFEQARNGWPLMPLQYGDGLAFKLFGVWERWDACWYARIATFGYSPDGSTAFFPLFPLLERGVALGGPHVVVAGMAVNLVAMVFALWGVYRIAAAEHGDPVARRSLLLLSVFPASFFLLAPFSEAVFLALAVWALERARARSWAAAAALALLAGSGRPVGGLLFLPLAWLVLKEWRAGTRGRGLAWPAAAVAAAPLAGLAYLQYTVGVVGQSMLDAQARWSGAPFSPPWQLFGETWRWIARTGDPFQALQLGLLVALTAVFALGFRRLPAELTLYVAPLLLLAWTRILPTPLTSTARQMTVMFPLFITLALLLEDRRALWSYAILSLLLLGALANEFVIGNFVG